MNQWARKFVNEIARLNKELGDIKFQQLTDAMDFIRCVFGTPGKIGCIVVCYLCSHCCSCPKYDYHWCVIEGAKGAAANAAASTPLVIQRPFCLGSKRVQTQRLTSVGTSPILLWERTKIFSTCCGASMRF